MFATSSAELIGGEPAVLGPVVVAVVASAVNDLLDEEFFADERALAVMRYRLVARDILDDDDAELASHTLSELGERRDFLPVGLVSDVSRRHGRTVPGQRGSRGDAGLRPEVQLSAELALCLAAGLRRERVVDRAGLGPLEVRVGPA